MNATDKLQILLDKSKSDMEAVLLCQGATEDFQTHYCENVKDIVLYPKSACSCSAPDNSDLIADLDHEAFVDSCEFEPVRTEEERTYE